ncbi:MAG: nuclear transport factor 2 family protein [Gemmataceae bacterium]|nr:nuclear transport factor 2 family protein [Gemmataceae bacterium]
MHRLSATAVALTAVAALALAGCGDKPPQAPDMGGEDGKKVAALVEDLNDASSPKKFDALFAPGSKPSNPKAYAQHTFSVAGKPAVSGATATCKVRVDTTAGAPKGEVEWAFAKDGDKWQIKSAPLP